MPELLHALFKHSAACGIVSAEIARLISPKQLLTFTALDGEEKIKNFMEYCEQRVEDLLSEMS